MALSDSSLVSLLDLANETQIEVFSYLPGKDIQRARRVCTHLRDLIDKKGNKMMLFEPGQARSHQRLRDSISSQWDYTNIDYLAALRRFLKARGVPVYFSVHEIITLRIFTKLWISQHPELRTSRPYVLQRKLLDVANALVTAHRAESTLREASHDLLTEVFTDLDWPEIGFSKAALQGWRSAILEEPLTARGDHFDAPVASMVELDPPGWPLTPMTLICPDSAERLWGHYSDGVPGHSKLAASFDLPPLPGYCDLAFAYCVRSLWAWEMIEGALEGNICEAKKTALLEEIVVF